MFLFMAQSISSFVVGFWADIYIYKAVENQTMLMAVTW